MDKVTVEFLRSKLKSGYSQWAKYDIEYKSQSTNIHRLSNSVFSFTEYNFLPVNEQDILDGHFTLFVNKDTFQYLIYKSSDYGGLTYVREVEFKGFLSANDLPQVSKEHIESIIAHKLLTSYFYDGNHINQQGALLFPRAEDDTDIYAHRSLISDNRGYVWCDTRPETYSDVELQALNILCGFVQPDIKEFDNELLNSIAKQLDIRKKGSTKMVPLTINNELYHVVHHRQTYYGNQSYLVKGKCELVGNTGMNADRIVAHEYLNHKVKDFVRIIPTILKNYAE